MPRTLLIALLLVVGLGDARGEPTDLCSVLTPADLFLLSVPDGARPKPVFDPLAGCQYEVASKQSSSSPATMASLVFTPSATGKTAAPEDVPRKGDAPDFIAKGQSGECSVSQLLHVVVTYCVGWTAEGIFLFSGFSPPAAALRPPVVQLRVFERALQRSSER